MHGAVTVAAILLASYRGAAGAKEASFDHAFCIVGAGPGGVQLGHFLNESSSDELRDYIIFERAPAAGHFFREYPKHRELISINKRFHSPGHGPGYGFRQDWNSLLGRPDIAPVTNRTKEFFPHADLLADYIEDFAAAQVSAGKIVLNTSVERVSKDAQRQAFELTLKTDSKLRTVTCGHVIMANGLWTPKTQLWNFVHGAELMIGYDELPHHDVRSEASVAEWEARFQGKDVAIFGQGNAAMEVAQAILPMAASVHVIGHSPERYSDITHYPGDIRAHRREILDHFQLKMASTQTHAAGEFGIVPCFGSKLCLLLETEALEYYADAEGSEIVSDVLELIKKKAAAGTLVQGEDYDVDLAADNQQEFDQALQRHSSAKARYQRMRTPLKILRSADTLEIRMSALLKPNNSDLLQLVLERRQWLKADETRDPFDVVLRCVGWRHNTSVYDASAMPKLMKNGKHAEVTDSYESVNVAGLYFAGTLAHGPDFRRSAGGFIHGFRYSARALSRILAFHRGHDWEGKKDFTLPDSFPDLQRHMLHRIQEASGPYHMFDTLVDGIVFSEENCSATYMEEVPKQFYLNHFRGSPRIEWVFNYGVELYDSEKAPKNAWEENEAVQDIQRSYADPFLHPIMRYFSGNSADPKHVLHIHADFVTRWSSAVTHVSMVRRFLEFAIKQAFAAQGACAAARNPDWRQAACSAATGYCQAG